MVSSNSKKLTIFILACLVAFGPLSIDMYLPALPTIANDLSIYPAQIKQTITIFLIGFSLGMLFYGPLSDKFGRRNLLILGIIIYLISTLWIIFVSTIEMLLIARLLQALGGASASVLARAIVRDLFNVNEAAKILSFMHIITMIATLIAPILGNSLLHLFGWEAIFGFLFLFALIALLLFCNKIPETLDSKSRTASLKGVFFSYYKILTTTKAIAYILCMAAAFAGMFIYITASSFVFIVHFEFTTKEYAYFFAFNIFGIMLMTFVNAYTVSHFGPNKMIQYACTILLMTSISLILQGLFYTSSIGIMVSIWCFVAMTGSLSANCISALMALFPQNAGAASGIAISTQFGLGALMSWLISLFSQIEPWPMTTLMSIMGVISFLSMIVATYKIRRW